jgi:hypothetical protein
LANSRSVLPSAKSQSQIQLTGGIAHDFNNLAAIIGSLEIARRRATDASCWPNGAEIGETVLPADRGAFDAALSQALDTGKFHLECRGAHPNRCSARVSRRRLWIGLSTAIGQFTFALAPWLLGIVRDETGGYVSGAEPVHGAPARRGRAGPAQPVAELRAVVNPNA